MVRKVHQSRGRGARRSRSTRRGDPVLVFAGRRYALESVMSAAGVPTTTRLAELARVTPERVRQWKHRGLSFSQADELCCRLGLHVSEIEPDYFDEALTGTT